MIGAFILYLVKATVCFVAFSLFFRLLLIRETFFRFTRVALIVGLLICSLLPLIKIEIKQPHMFQKPIERLEKIVASYKTSENGFAGLDARMGIPEGGERSLISEGIGLTAPNQKMRSSEEGDRIMSYGKEPVVSQRKGFSFIYIVFVIYLLGLSVMCIRLVLSLRRLWLLFRNSPITECEGYRLVICREDIVPFSFFNYIALSEADYHSNAREIILHEQMHIRYRHNIDVMFSELLLLIHWFNPAIWSLYNDLREVHEYEADNGVIEQGTDARAYQLLLVKKAVGERRFTSVVNSFNQSKIKNRITMMLRKESNSWARLKVLLIVPLMAGVLLAFSHPEKEQKMESLLSQDKGKSMAEQVQENPFFYWEELQQFCKEKGIDLKEMVRKTLPSNQVVQIQVNSENQMIYENHLSKVEFKTPEEGNSAESLRALKKIIVEAMDKNNPDPVYFTLLDDGLASTRFVFTFLNSTLPAAYEAALNDMSERDNIPVVSLRKEKPLLLLYGIPENEKKEGRVEKKWEKLKSDNIILRTSAMKDGKENNLFYSVHRSKKNQKMGVVEVLRIESYSEQGKGTQISYYSSYSAASLFDSVDITLVVTGSEIPISDIEETKEILDNKLKTRKSIFVMSMPIP